MNGLVEALKRASGESNVRALRPCDHMFSVQGIVFVPVHYAVAVAAPNPEAACRIAGEIVRNTPKAGAVDFAHPSNFGVTAVNYVDKTGAFVSVEIPPGVSIDETGVSLPDPRA